MSKFAGFSFFQMVRPTFAANRPSAVFDHHHHNDDGGDYDDYVISVHLHTPCGDHV